MTAAYGAGAGLAHVIGVSTEPILERSIGAALREAAAMWPARAALVDGGPGEGDDRRWSFAGLLADAERVAHALLARFEPGEHVAIWAANCPEWVLSELGAALAGITLVTVNPAYGAEEVAFVLRQSQACGLLVQNVVRGRDLVAIVEAARAALPKLRHVIPLAGWSAFLGEGGAHPLPHVGPDAIAQIQYTSGTTGRPKGARLTHRGIANDARLYARTIGARHDDVWANPMPLFHTAGCGLVTLGALQTGGTQVLPRHFDPGLMLGLMERERCTVTLGVPTMLVRLLDDDSIGRRDLSSWRLVTLGGAPIPPDLVRRLERRGLKVAIGYGQTEASPYLTHTLPDDPHPDWVSTVGPPMPNIEIKIADVATGATVAFDTVGEILGRSFGVMRDYFDQPKATRAAIDADGWLHTGDLGSLDARGYCRVVGRLKDMIIRGGENIYPREIEDRLFEHAGVANVAVVGVPDREWGEVPVAFLVLKPGATAGEAQLVAHCRETLASFKVPRLWRFVDGLPQTASGKVQKFVLRQRWLEERRLDAERAPTS